ncbi:MAG: iron-containing alcohol dehydrogenase [Clostridiales bacterium]|jgi:alcohol dehydrogenase class IV|nr:iron-containing alcohol dehydrogenase [Clostridiales bacterium]
MSLFNVYCRVYQNLFKVAVNFFNWRTPELIEGEGSLSRLPALIKEHGFKRVMLITDANMVKLGFAGILQSGMEELGLACAVYDGTQPNPDITNIEAAVKIYKENDCQCIVALGGGSPMDCAKATGARIARPEKTIRQMKGLLKVGKDTPRFYAVPTTSGSGSEATIAAVVSNHETHEKYPINDLHLIPDYAVLDPVLPKGLPPHITSTTGMDALCHAVEAYIGHSNTKQTEEYAIEAAKLIFDNLIKAYKNGGDLGARRNMQVAAFKAGVAFTRAYVGNIHAIAHTLGGFYNTPHGLANAVVMPYVLTEYGESAHKRLAELADAVGLTGGSDAEKAAAFIEAIKDMNAAMNIPDKIEGIKDEDIDAMIENAFKEANPLYPVPKIFTREDFKKIYKAVQK